MFSCVLNVCVRQRACVLRSSTSIRGQNDYFANTYTFIQTVKAYFD